MEWNAFNLINPGIEKTKEILFPFNLKNWMKLGLVSLFSRTKWRGSFNPSNFSSFKSSKDTSTVTGRAISGLQKVPFPLGLVIAIMVFLVLVLGLVTNFITSVFTFIFIDDLVEKKYDISKGWKKNLGNGVSYFWFRIVFGIIFLIALAVVFLPFIIPVAQHGWNVNLTSYLTNAEIWTRVAFSGVLLIMWVVLASLFMFFVSNFSLVDMYKNNIGISPAIRDTFSRVGKQKAESFIYWLAAVIVAIVLGIIGGIAGLTTGLVALLVAGIIGAPVFIPLYLAVKLTSWFWIVFGIYVFIWILILVYVIHVVILPLSCFREYFSILAYEKMFGTNLISKKKKAKK